MLRGALDTLGGVVISSFNLIRSLYEFLTSGEVAVNEHYSVLRHSRPFVLYRSTKTTVTISIFGSKPLPRKRRVFLQKRGYRTGLFGWAIGSMLGGSKLPGLEVTPVSNEAYSSMPSSMMAAFEKDRERVWRPYNLTHHQLLETMEVHIPVKSGDGYFRLRVTPADKPSETLAVSPTFRIGSVTWASASPQGATPLGLIPELAVKSAFVTANTAMWAVVYSMVPVYKVTHWMPGPVKSFIFKNAYEYAGGPDPRLIDEQYQITERMKAARESFHRKIPYGAASIRTVYDLEKDEEMGRQGTAYMS
ncbi:hypothetical protein FRB91_000588 [Serendipita sp. 411]|nr:hypothetical protein FRC15_009325 [Serendipita sp. 397]KAG8800387.1 hypothetical protein FRC16_003011 [Serendipita sp. 398]KAG8860801.1 hypothetical protein FRB91_000588 [Serendipita sp. 411]